MLEKLLKIRSQFLDVGIDYILSLDFQKFSSVY
jgi:hypothetical protein